MIDFFLVYNNKTKLLSKFQTCKYSAQFFHGWHLEANPNKNTQQIYRGIVFLITKVFLTSYKFR